MKKFLIILSLIFLSGFYAVAQDDDDGNERIRDKMREFIQKRLNLSKNEAERFTPVFLRYFREWRIAIRDNRKDPIMLQKRVAEVRLQYRNQFQEIIGEKRSNSIYIEQERFIREIKQLQQERLQKEQPRKRFRSILQ